MSDPTSTNTNEELNTAKQVNLANVGALDRAQLTPPAAAEPQGHDVSGHDHAALPDGHDHDGHHHGPAGERPYLVPAISLALLLAGIAFDYFGVAFFAGVVRPAWFGVAYLLVGWKVIRSAVQSIPSGYSTPLFLVVDNEQVACRSIVPVKLAVELRHPGYRSPGGRAVGKNYGHVG